MRKIILSAFIALCSISAQAKTECLPLNSLDETEKYCPVDLKEGDCELSVQLIGKEPAMVDLAIEGITSRNGQFRGMKYLYSSLDPYFATVQVFRSNEGRYLISSVVERWEKFDDDYKDYDKRTSQITIVGPKDGESPVVMTRNEHREQNPKFTYGYYYHIQESDQSVKEQDIAFESRGTFAVERQMATGIKLQLSCDL